MSIPRTDFAAPHWLVQLLRSKPASVPWNAAIRAAVALAFPLVVAFSVGKPQIGALISTGALPIVMADMAGSYSYRFRRLSGAGVAAIIGFSLGLVTSGQAAASIPVVIAIAAASAVISSASSNASVAGLQLFVFCVLGTGQHLLGVPTHVSLLCFVTGVAWSLLVALIGWTINATTPERTTIAQVFIELAAMLSAEDEETSRIARQQLTTAMNNAYDQLLTARSWLSGRDATYRQLLNLLAASTPAVEAGVALVNAGRKPPREVIDYLVTVAAAVLADQQLPEPPAHNPDFDPLYRGLSKIRDDVKRKRRAPVSFHSWLQEWAQSLISGPVTWFAALRLALCVGVAELVGWLIPVERSYWITLTVGLVLKPDFGSVFGRAVLRGLGTVVGVGIGAIALGIGVRGWPVVILIALFAAGVAIGKVRNYAIVSAFATSVIILQMDLASYGDWHTVLARLTDTVLGCAIVLIFGYLLWPGSRRPRIGELLVEGISKVRIYADTAFGHISDTDLTVTERAERARSRRRAYRALTDTRTAFQQVIVEPSAAGRQAVAWWPVIAGVERVADAITEVVVSVEHGATPPPEHDIRLINSALNELAAAMREQRAPAKVSLPESPQLAGVTDQLTAVLDVVRGPDLAGKPQPRGLRRWWFRRRHST